MGYLIDAVMNPKETVKRLKSKGWSTAALMQFYPFFSECAVVRHSRQESAIPPTFKINNTGLLKLYDVVADGGDVEALAEKLGITLEECEDLGFVITKIMRMRSREMTYSTFKNMLIMMTNDIIPMEIARQLGANYNDVLKFQREVYRARKVSLRGF